VLGAHRLHHQLVAGHLAVAVHRQAALLELLAELLLVVVVQLVDLALDLLVDDLRLERGTHRLELAEDDLAVDQFVEDLVAGVLQLAVELGAASRELGGELGVDRRQHERDLVLGDHAAVHLRGDGVDFDRAGAHRAGRSRLGVSGADAEQGGEEKLRFHEENGETPGAPRAGQRGGAFRLKALIASRESPPRRGNRENVSRREMGGQRAGPAALPESRKVASCFDPPAGRSLRNHGA